MSDGAGQAVGGAAARIPPFNPGEMAGRRLQLGRTHKSGFSLNVRFTSKATELLRRRELQRWAIIRHRASHKNYSDEAWIGGCTKTKGPGSGA